MSSYDLVVIGAGPGGYVTAIRGAQLGMNVALVEKNPTLGGTCLNVGCIPSKAMLESSETYEAALHHHHDHGVIISNVKLDLKKMLERKEGIVSDLTSGIAMLMKKNKVKVITGHGTLISPNTIRVDSESESTEIEAQNIVLAMGSDVIELPFMPFDGTRVVSSTEALSFSKIPRSLVVIGAGAVGLELGSVWRRLGAEVTVVELLPTITPFADKQIAKSLQRSLQAQGMHFKMQTKVIDAKVMKSKVKLTIEDKNGDTESLEAETVLVSVGRRPLSGTAGLEEAGIEFEGGGRVKVDENFRTNLPNVYAIGDLIRGPMLAHKAEDEGVAVAEIINNQAGHVNYDTIPSIVYTDPELAMAGKTEAELKEAGIPFSSGKAMFGGNGRAKSLGQTHGLVKILAHKETDEILGVHMIGPRVSELIAEAVSVMEFNGSAEDLARTVHAHPTLSETVKEAAMAVGKRAIHG